MSDSFEWRLETQGLSGRAMWTVNAGARCLTAHENVDEDRIGRSLIIDPEPLTAWVVANWWRLRWEGERPALSGGPRRQPTDWRMSHSVAAAGQGFCWPDLVFSSDGDSIFCSSKATSGENAPIRFINDMECWVPALDFERELDRAVEVVLSSLPTEHDLSLLWREIREERESSSMTTWRSLEARLGYDPDEAPSELISRLVQARDELGGAAVDELASSGVENHDRLLAELRASLSRSKNHMRLDAFSSVDHTHVHSSPVADTPPWRIGTHLAARARDCLGIATDPLDDRTLSESLSLSVNVLESRAELAIDAAGLRSGEEIRVALSSRFKTSRRFALARLVGDAIYAKGGGPLLPVTRSKTVRQKVQRAFAQEYLCPYAGLIDFLQTEAPSDEQIDIAAQHYHVDPRVVEHALANHSAS